MRLAAYRNPSLQQQPHTHTHTLTQSLRLEQKKFTNFPQKTGGSSRSYQIAKLLVFSVTVAAFWGKVVKVHKKAKEQLAIQVGFRLPAPRSPASQPPGFDIVRRKQGPYNDSFKRRRSLLVLVGIPRFCDSRKGSQRPTTYLDAPCFPRHPQAFLKTRILPQKKISPPVQPRRAPLPICPPQRAESQHRQLAGRGRAARGWPGGAAGPGAGRLGGAGAHGAGRPRFFFEGGNS